MHRLSCVECSCHAACRQKSCHFLMYIMTNNIARNATLAVTTAAYSSCYVSKAGQRSRALYRVVFEARACHRCPPALANASCMQQAFTRTSFSPIVGRCSPQYPVGRTPSLSAMIVNHFKMPSNIVSYNLNGMGCSAGVIAISLARELLQVRADWPHPGFFQKKCLESCSQREVLALCLCLCTDLCKIAISPKQHRAGGVYRTGDWW